MVPQVASYLEDQVWDWWVLQLNCNDLLEAERISSRWKNLGLQCQWDSQAFVGSNSRTAHRFSTWKITRYPPVLAERGGKAFFRNDLRMFSKMKACSGKKPWHHLTQNREGELPQLLSPLREEWKLRNSAEGCSQTPACDRAEINHRIEIPISFWGKWGAPG